MKGSTFARKAKAAGWKVSTSDGGRRILIKQEDRAHSLDDYMHGRFRTHVGCGTFIYIHVDCDDDGDVVSVSRTVRQHYEAGDEGADLVGATLKFINERQQP